MLRRVLRPAAAVRPRSRRPVLMEPVEPRVLFASFSVTTAADSGAGSLRQAIIGANGNGNPLDQDTIQFAVGTGAVTINLLSALPAITQPVLIDGFTQPPGNSAVPVVELNGTSAGAADGLTIATEGEEFLSTIVTGLVINRFGGNGVRITGDYNIVDVCHIGTDSTGTVNLGNGGRGVLIEASGSHNAVSGGSIVAFNRNDGIAVLSGVGNNFGGSAVFANGGTAIDLGPDGPTANDGAGDADTGANNLQNAPVLSSITFSNGDASVSGSLTTTSNTDVVIDFYANRVSAAEGRRHLKVVQGTTNAAGTFTFTNEGLAGVAPNEFVTAVATPYNRGETPVPFDTSEFSAPIGTAGGDSIPRVQQVFVRSSAWTAGYLNSLAANGTGSATNGFAIQGGAEQHNELPWNNINQVRIQFTENVSIQAADVVLTSSRPAGAPGVNNLIYDPATFTATVELNRALVNEKLTVRVDGDAGAGVTDLDGTPNLLDGEWTNPTSTNPPAGGDAYPSGNGTAGGDFVFSMRALPGDFDRNGSVGIGDFNILRANFGQANRSILQGDLDGSGTISIADFNGLRAGFGRTTPF